MKLNSSMKTKDKKRIGRGIEVEKVRRLAEG